MIPEDFNIPNQIIPLTYSLFAYILFKILLGKKVENHINEGGFVYG